MALFQHFPPDWFETVGDAEPVWAGPGGIRCTTLLARWEPPRMHTKVEYRLDDNVWTHSWVAYRISDDELTSDLAAADLRFGDWLTDDHAWFTARQA